MADMIDVHELQQAVVWDHDGAKLGNVAEVHLDSGTNDPEWITVPLHLFETKTRFIPLSGARINGDDIFVAYSQEQVNSSPDIHPGSGLNFAQEEQLREYYGLVSGIIVAEES